MTSTLAPSDNNCDADVFDRNAVWDLHLFPDCKYYKILFAEDSIITLVVPVCQYSVHHYTWGG